MTNVKSVKPKILKLSKRMMRIPLKEAYEDLALMPCVIAETVAKQEYTGEEISIQLRDAKFVAETEAKRKLMTDEQIEEFADECDTRCKAAYQNERQWFMKCVRSKTNVGRDTLYMYIRHWLSSYLKRKVLIVK